LAALTYFACLFIPKLLPQYSESIVPAQVMALSAPVLGLGIFSGGLLGAIGYERFVLLLQVLLLMVRAVLLAVALLLGGQLLQVALVSGISGMAAGIAITSGLCRPLGLAQRKIFRALTIPLLFVSALILVEWVRIAWFGWPHLHLRSAAASCATLLLLLCASLLLVPESARQMKFLLASTPRDGDAREI
jgi:hypothetical protein